MLPMHTLWPTGCTVVSHNPPRFPEKELSPRLDRVLSYLQIRSTSSQVISSILDSSAHRTLEAPNFCKLSGLEVAGLVLAGVSAAFGVKLAASHSKDSQSEGRRLTNVTESWLICMLINLFVS